MTHDQTKQNEQVEPSPTAGMNIVERILHVGGRENAAGYIEFGSVQAVEALVRHVLRDLPKPKQAVPDQSVIKEAVGKLHMLLMPVPAAEVTALEVCKVVSEQAMEIINLLQQAAPAAERVEIPDAIERMAVARYKVVPAHESMFHRWAVVAGDGTQQLYIGRQTECQNVAAKFTGAFLDGAFVAMQMAPQHADQEPSQAASDAYDRIDHFLRQRLDDHDYAHYSFDLDLVFGAAQQAAPVERVSLTRDQALEIVNANPDVMTAIRMTEAAHGITGGKHGAE